MRKRAGAQAPPATTTTNTNEKNSDNNNERRPKAPQRASEPLGGERRRARFRSFCGAGSAQTRPLTAPNWAALWGASCERKRWPLLLAAAAAARKNANGRLLGAKRAASRQTSGLMMTPEGRLPGAQAGRAASWAGGAATSDSRPRRRAPVKVVRAARCQPGRAPAPLASWPIFWLKAPVLQPQQPDGSKRRKKSVRAAASHMLFSMAAGGRLVGCGGCGGHWRPLEATGGGGRRHGAAGGRRDESSTSQ